MDESDREDITFETSFVNEKDMCEYVNESSSSPNTSRKTIKRILGSNADLCKHRKKQRVAPVTADEKLGKLCQEVFEDEQSEQLQTKSKAVKTTFRSPFVCKYEQNMNSDKNRWEELALRKEIGKLRKEIDLMKRVKKNRMSNEKRVTMELIDKWKEAGQRTAGCLFNEAKIKIEKLGGMEQYQEKQKESRKRKKQMQFDDSMIYEIEEYMESEEFSNLDRYDQKEVIDKKVMLERQRTKIENEESSQNSDLEIESEFTMNELFKQMQIDIKLFF